MSSAFSIKALDVHTWFYKQFETIAITWIPKQQIFRYVSEQRQLIIWSLNTILAALVGNGYCIFILTKQLLSPSLIYSYEILIVQLTISVFADFWLVVFVASILYGENFVTVWNSYRKILLEARRKIPCKLKLLIQL